MIEDGEGGGEKTGERDPQDPFFLLLFLAHPSPPPQLSLLCRLLLNREKIVVTIFLGPSPDDSITGTAQQETHRHHTKVVFYILNKKRKTSYTVAIIL